MLYLLFLSIAESLSLESTGWEGKWNDDMNRLSNLVFLDVSQNMLSGTMSLHSMTELQYLTMSNNRFEGNLDDILTCDQCPDKLVSFISIDNPLSGQLPILTNFTRLESFLVSGARITGSIPTEFGLLTQLSNLDLSDNIYLSGVLPTELATLSNLEYFNIGGSSISGTIPSEFGQLQSLEELYLSAPFLTGTIPDAICGIGTLVGISYTDNLECPCAGERVCILS
jgi:Leucine-rich repeat (LRR) protein